MSTVLVIDDEKANTDVLKKMLNQLGYKVKVKNSCIETLKNFRQHYAKYNLVITDLTMPDMNGLELAKQINVIRPEFPIILMTGYGENVSNKIQKQYGIDNIIGKPITIRELSSVIRKVIDK